MMNRLRVLLVEDNPGDADLVQEYLSDARQVTFEVECEPRLAEAIARLAGEPFDLILLDLGLPDGSGLETLRRVLCIAGTTPIVVLTGLHDEQTGLEAVRLGAQDYILKGHFERNVLIRTILFSLERKRTQEKLETLVYEMGVHKKDLETKNEALRKIEQDLNESRSKYIDLYDFAPVGYVTVDDKGFIQGANLTAARLLGSNREIMIEKPFSCYLSKDDEDAFHLYIKGLIESGRRQTCELQLPKEDSASIHVLLDGLVVHDGQGGCKQCRIGLIDITERKHAEQKLKRQTAILTAVLNSPNETVALLDTNGAVLEVNSKGAERFGMLPEEMVGRNVCSLIPEPVAGNGRKIFEEIMRTGQPVHFEDRRGNTDYANSVYPVMDPQSGELLGVTIFASDITERKQAEAERGRLMAAIEQVAEAIVVTDTQGSIQYVNPAFESITGYTRSEAVGRNPRFLKSGEHDEEFYKQLWGTITAGRVWSGRIINKRKDGRIYYEEATISPVKEASGKVTNFVAVNRDITEHLNLSKQLQQAQKMEAVGNLAGGVAHDFNNVLQVVLGYSELLLSDEKLTHLQRSDLHKVHDSARRGADLVKRLLTFSRKSEIAPKPLNLNRCISDFRKMLERTVPKMIDIQLILAKELNTINADPTQVDQVLMNLAVNARDAMPDGGKLIFETANIVLDDDYAKTHLEAGPGRHILLTVSDTGSGMNRQTLEHIFEPFFTTKGVGEGTGLGLAMVHGIVKQHGGHIRCYSEPGHGTIFNIYFPAVVSEEDTEHTSVIPMPRGGSETILLVDDEEMIRDLASRILKKAGYRVIEASDGKEALDIYYQRADEISLVLLDLIMPKMGGRECLQGLLEFNPTLKVIVASGYSANGPSKDALSKGAKGFVNKPYDVRQVLEVIRSVLDEPEGKAV